MMQNGFKYFLEKMGLIGWMVQRISGMIIVFYFAFILSYLWAHDALHYWQWNSFFAQPAMKIFTLVTLLSVLIHAWIGVWTISTDYIHCCYTRKIVNAGAFFLLGSYLIWGVQILWSMPRVYS